METAVYPKNIFDADVTQEVIDRLTPESQPKWGKMDVAQMLAHLNVPYEYVFTDNYKRPNAVMRFVLKQFAKKVVVNEKPYKKNSPTAPDFKKVSEEDFDKQKALLIEYLKRTQELGPDHFDGKMSHSFGKLNKKEWNNMFYKHLDHHLGQFGV